MKTREFFLALAVAAAAIATSCVKEQLEDPQDKPEVEITGQVFEATITRDESGKIMETDVFDHVWIDETFRSFEPQDVDNDGIYEIVCSQYASLGDYSSCIGYASTTLKYNTEIKQFEIIRANFYPYSK